MRQLFVLLALAACADPPKPAVTPRPPAVTPDPPAVAMPPPAPILVRRIAVFNDRPSGTVETEVRGDTVTIATAIVQNGRGPKTRATLHLAEDGTIASLSIIGTHTFGTKVDESFSRPRRSPARSSSRSPPSTPRSRPSTASTASSWRRR
jgi:hypothetical protein